jgi:toxin ParE1/3/4
MESTLMKIEWTSSALQNLQEIYSEAAILNTPAAETVLNSILDEVDGLASAPLIGREGRVEDTRELLVSTTPLVVVYRISHNVIQILAVLQGAAIAL